MFSRREPARSTFCLVLLSMAAACGGGGGSNSPLSSNVPPEMVVSRARVDSSHRFAEVALRTGRNLGTGRVSDRVGPEVHPRMHPDGVRLVFSRQRLAGDEESRELYLSTIDGSVAELRLTVNLERDEDPVWSPDGSRILFSSERDGDAALWTINDSGGDAQPFLSATGFADVEPDWHAASDRVCFSRRDTNGHHTIWVVNGTGFGAVPLTDGGSTSGDGNGDRQPAYSPDGTSIVFVRRSSADQATLATCEVASGIVTEVFIPIGDIALPRYSPTMDSYWFGIAEPTLGRQTLRLAQMRMGDTEPTLVWPDERWEYRGLDFLPVGVATATPGTVTRLNVREATVQISVARNAFGAQSQLSEDDGNEYYLETADGAQGQVAGIDCRFNLPIDEPEDLFDVRVRALVRASDIAGSSVFRISVRNLTDNRYDTAVELTPTSTGVQTMEFRTSSLRHITQEKVLQFTVIADLDTNDPADFWIDMVEVEVLPKAP